MSAERARLRVIDGNGEIDDDAVVLPGDYALLIEQNAKHLRTIAALRGEITKLRKVDPLAETIMEIMEYWRERTGRPRAKIPLDGSRARVTKARLADFTPDQLKATIDAVAAWPFQGKFGVRFCCDGPDRKRKDELELIFRDERHIEDLLKLAQGDAEHAAYRAYVHGLCQSSPNVLLALAILGDKPPHGEVLRKAALWAHKQV